MDSLSELSRSLYALAFFIGLLSLLPIYLFWTNNRKKIRTLSPAGWNRGPSDPLFGDLAVAMKTGSLHHYLLEQHKGGRCPVVAFWWRNKRVVGVCSQKAFKDTESIYNRPSHILASCFDPLHGSDSIQSVNGEEWKRQRKMLRGTIRGGSLESFFPDLVPIAQETIETWSSGKPIHLLHDISRMTLKAILVTSLGNVFEDNNGIEELAALYHVCKCEMDERILNVPLPDSQREIDFQLNLKKLQEHLKKMINTRRSQHGSGKELPLMDALLNSNDSEEMIMSNVVTFMGGFHTSGYYLTWAFYYLAQHPQVQDKLIAEIEERVGMGNGDKLKEYVLKSDTYLRQFLDETLRMSTVASFSPHCPDKDVMVDGYLIPANTPIIHSIGVAMHNPSVWDNPGEFDPDRFGSKGKHAKRGHEFRPFGISSLRRCPANHFTYMMSSVYIAILLRKFVFLSKDEVVAKKYGKATSPGHDIDFQAIIRE